MYIVKFIIKKKIIEMNIYEFRRKKIKKNNMIIWYYLFIK